jgi:thymidylate kinase
MTNWIIEGTDRTGKSTLIQEFIKQDPDAHFDVRHCKNPPDSLTREEQKEYARQEYIRGIKDLNEGCGIIYDRFLLGECIYSPIFRGYYPDYMRALEKTLNENTVLIVLTASPELIASRFDGKFIKVEQIPEIVRRFEEEFEASNITRKLLVRVDKMTPTEIYDYIMEWEDGYSRPIKQAEEN